MNLRGRNIYSGLILIAGVMLLAASLRPQAPAGGPAWQYCSVTTPLDNRTGQATICYATASGCRNEEVSNQQGSPIDASMQASSKLGDQGWELISAMGSPTGIRTLYFKRLKALDNSHILGR